MFQSIEWHVNNEETRTKLPFQILLEFTLIIWNATYEYINLGLGVLAKCKKSAHSFGIQVVDQKAVGHVVVLLS